MPSSPPIAQFNTTTLELKLSVEEISRHDKTSWTIFLRAALVIPEEAVDQLPVSGMSPNFFIHIDSNTVNTAPVLLGFKDEISMSANIT